MAVLLVTFHTFPSQSAWLFVVSVNDVNTDFYKGTRCRAIEKYLKEEAPHKHLVFILNKCGECCTLLN